MDAPLAVFVSCSSSSVWRIIITVQFNSYDVFYLVAMGFLRTILEKIISASLPEKQDIVYLERDQSGML